MRLDDEVIDGSAEEGARVLAMSLLDDAEAAASRYAKAEDEEALHDFRVGLRRVRSALRAYRPWLSGSVTRKLERRLRKQARATNAARDAEVQLAWVAAKRDALPHPRHHAGLDLLLARYEARRREGDPARVVARFERAARRLRRRLQTYERRVDGGARATFGGVLATLIGDHLEALRDRLDAIRGAGDRPGVHAARIAGKRLRYLLEPLRGQRHADGDDAVRLLKRLQELLGDLHDSHVLAEELAAALVDASAQRARLLLERVALGGAPGERVRDALRESPRPGLLALAHLLRERRDALFADVERQWRADAFEGLSAEVLALARALEARAGGKLERERRFLLSSLPPRAAAEAAEELILGWLPGARLRERIRHVRATGEDRYWRGLKQGVGRLRVESEEETTRAVFEALWPLTEGRRLAKRRRRVEDGRLAWDVDEVIERGVVLARVRFPPGAGEVPLPDWLRPLVVREVTDDPEFRDEHLAEGPAAPAPPAPPGPPEDPLVESAPDALDQERASPPAPPDAPAPPLDEPIAP